MCLSGNALIAHQSDEEDRRLLSFAVVAIITSTVVALPQFVKANYCTSI